MVRVAREDSLPDWSYRDARRRLLDAGRAVLPRHGATGRMDDDGNRVVECGCGWTGNGLGWAGHLDSVIRSALEG